MVSVYVDEHDAANKVRGFSPSGTRDAESVQVKMQRAWWPTSTGCSCKQPFVPFEVTPLDSLRTQVIVRLQVQFASWPWSLLIGTRSCSCADPMLSGSGGPKGEGLGNNFPIHEVRPHRRKNCCILAG